MQFAKQIDESMIQAVLDNRATKEETNRVYDAAATDAYVRERLGLESLKENEVRDRQQCVSVDRFVTTTILGTIFLLAGLLWLHANVTGSALRLVLDVIFAISAFGSAYVVTNWLQERDKA